jgi:uncharacterized protein YfiM (DUF2279 family)
MFRGNVRVRVVVHPRLLPASTTPPPMAALPPAMASVAEDSLLTKAERAPDTRSSAEASDAVHQISLHGEHAARRQAITELLFFCSVGDLNRCRRIARTWRIAVSWGGDHLVWDRCGWRPMGQGAGPDWPLTKLQDAWPSMRLHPAWLQQRISTLGLFPPGGVSGCCCCCCSAPVTRSDAAAHPSACLPLQPQDDKCCDYDRRTPL